MQRHGNLFDQLVSWPNLLAAVRKAARGKRFRDNVGEFLFDYERELLGIERALRTGSYRPGHYRSFFIYEPKQRLISAAPFRDRVVHHALCNVIEPLFERGFIFDSYACRKGKGSHAAVARAQHYARRFHYVLKADIRKFFPSIDHRILKNLLARRIKDPQVQWLVNKIIDGSNPQEPVCQWFPGDDLFTASERRRGLPIGNQTSQFFANVYLNPLDHEIKDRLAMPGYVRYVDDLLVFSYDKRELAHARSHIVDFLQQLRLKLHPEKSVIFPTRCGIPFLGFRIFPSYRLLAKSNVKRFRHRMRRLQHQYASGQVAVEELGQRVMSWLGHAGHADTYRLRTRLFEELRFCKSGHSSGHGDVTDHKVAPA